MSAEVAGDGTLMISLDNHTIDKILSGKDCYTNYIPIDGRQVEIGIGFYRESPNDSKRMWYVGDELFPGHIGICLNRSELESIRKGDTIQGSVVVKDIHWINIDIVDKHEEELIF